MVRYFIQVQGVSAHRACRFAGYFMKIDRMTLFFTVLAAVSGIAAYLTRGPSVCLEALAAVGLLLLKVIPLIMAAVMISGYVRTIIPSETVERWLGSSSGLRGWSIALLGGALTPGGPFASFPIVVALLRAGASFDVTVVYLTAWSVIGINRALIWEIPFFGIEFVAVKMLVSLPLPFIAGFVARALTLRFGGAES